MSLEKITKIVLDVKFVLASNSGAIINKAGAVTIVIEFCSCQRWGF